MRVFRGHPSQLALGGKEGSPAVLWQLSPSPDMAPGILRLLQRTQAGPEMEPGDAAD